MTAPIPRCQPECAISLEEPSVMTERLIQAAVDYEQAQGMYAAGARRELSEARDAIEAALRRAAPAEGRAEEALHEIAKEVFTDGTPTKAARTASAALALSRQTSGDAA